MADADSLAAKACTGLVMSSRQMAVDTVLCLKAGGRSRYLKSSTNVRRAVAPRRKDPGASTPTADTRAEEDTKEPHGNCCWPNCRKTAGYTDLDVVKGTNRRKAGMCLSSVCQSRTMSLASSVLHMQTR